jgi:hypothetical protein
MVYLANVIISEELTMASKLLNKGALRFKNTGRSNILPDNLVNAFKENWFRLCVMPDNTASETAPKVVGSAAAQLGKQQTFTEAYRNSFCIAVNVHLNRCSAAGQFYRGFEYYKLTDKVTAGGCFMELPLLQICGLLGIGWNAFKLCFDYLQFFITILLTFNV